MDLTLPNGWYKRKTNDREYIVSPDSERQYMSRIVALADMIKGGYEEPLLNEMRSKIVYEGWRTNKYLPGGWFCRFFEGGTRMGKPVKLLYFFTKEGQRIEGFKNVINYMMNDKSYSEEDIDKINLYEKLVQKLG